MHSRSPRHDNTGSKRSLRWLPLATAVYLIILAAAFVYANQLHHWLHGRQRSELTLQTGEYTISLYPKQRVSFYTSGIREARTLKISYPLNAASLGCELRYGVAVFEHSSLPESSWHFAFRNTRYLFKFKYDLKNKRCESRELFLLDDDLPVALTLQFVKLDLSSQAVREIPVDEGVRLRVLRGPETVNLEASVRDITPTFPFAEHSSTARNASFSIPEASQIELLIHPYDSLRAFVQREIRKRIEKCRSGAGCDRILAATAKISDPELLRAFEEARQAGIPVEIISNLRPRLDRETDQPETHGEILEYSPLFWLRGSPFSVRSRGFLPMHAKFIVFGDDLVISSNPNLRGGVRHKSREYSLVYSDPAAISIFKEIFTIIRTSLYYPLKVNLKDDLQILLNADRPRQYSVSSEKPHVAIDTDEQVRSNAYGILYELLARSSGPLKIAMSPLTSFCSYYTHRRCLYEELTRYAVNRNLRILLNGFFYLPRDDADRAIEPDFTGWDSAGLAGAIESSPGLTPLRAVFPFARGAPEVFIQMHTNLSTHHERLALLGDRVSILGSANWSHPSTINTIEILDSPALNQALADEMATFNDPWFVSEKDDSYQSEFAYGRCDFTFEVNAPATDSSTVYEASSREVLAELQRRFPEEPFKAPAIIEPVARPEPPLAQSHLLFKKTPLGQFDSSPAGYLCVEDLISGKTAVIRIAGNKN